MRKRQMREPETREVGEQTIIGIDISTRRAGVAVLPVDNPVQTYLVRNTQRDPSTVRGRDHFTREVLGRVLHTYDPLGAETHCFVESIIAVRNTRTAIDAAYLAGVLEARFSRAGIIVHHVPVSTWKRIAVGNAKASKEQVGDWFHQYFGYEPGSQDEADAAAIATCGKIILGRPIAVGERGSAASQVGADA